jgi:hypothetical protein
MPDFQEPLISEVPNFLPGRTDVEQDYRCRHPIASEPDHMRCRSPYAEKALCGEVGDSWIGFCAELDGA